MHNKFKIGENELNLSENIVGEKEEMLVTKSFLFQGS